MKVVMVVVVFVKKLLGIKSPPKGFIEDIMHR